MTVCFVSFLAVRVKTGEISGTNRTLKPLLIILGIVGGAVAVLQADLGSAAVLVAMTAAMAYVAGLPMKRVAQISRIIIVGLTLAIMTSAYRRERVATFLNPEADCQD